MVNLRFSTDISLTTKIFVYDSPIIFLSSMYLGILWREIIKAPILMYRNIRNYANNYCIP